MSYGRRTGLSGEVGCNNRLQSPPTAHGHRARRQAVPVLSAIAVKIVLGWLFGVMFFQHEAAQLAWPRNVST